MAAVSEPLPTPVFELAQTDEIHLGTQQENALAETCPTSMRPFVKAFFHAWLFMTFAVTCALTPTMSKSIDIFIAVFCVFIVLGLILLK